MLKDRLKHVRSQLKQRVEEKLRDLSQRGAAQEAETDTKIVAPKQERSDLETTGEDPPVVARLVVEIRSDGTRTIARGALKDEVSGEQVALEAKGTTPMQLAAQLAKNLLTTPLAARKLAREMIRARQMDQRASSPEIRDDPDSEG